MRIDRDVRHQFFLIELLGIEGIENQDLTRDDICIRGYTLDRRTMVLPVDKYDEVLGLSTELKHLA